MLRLSCSTTHLSHPVIYNLNFSYREISFKKFFVPFKQKFENKKILNYEMVSKKELELLCEKNFKRKIKEAAEIAEKKFSKNSLKN